jgi:hypothetical protein
MIWLFVLACFFFVEVFVFDIKVHPIEKRCMFLYNVKFPISYGEMVLMQDLFDIYPLLVIRKPNKVLSPREFIDFLTIFDKEHDKDAIQYPDNYPEQMLQPFDKLPDSKHVAPRGNFIRKNFLGMKNIHVKPSDPFIHNYVWHTDLLGHPTKNPGIVTGFHILKMPVIGGETDFISGETIYENLDREHIETVKSTRVIINRKNFAFGNKVMDYSGSYRIKDSYIKFPEENVNIPILFSPENEYETHKVLIMPSFVENIVGYNIADTDMRMKYFMKNSVLPHRFSIQWKEGDVCVFNNRRFIHSSTPARNYLDLTDNERLLFQTFLPTKNIFKIQ